MRGTANDGEIGGVGDPALRALSGFDEPNASAAVLEVTDPTQHLIAYDIG